MRRGGTWVAISRLARFLRAMGARLTEYFWRVRGHPERQPQWLQRTAQASLQALAIRVESVGTPPTNGILVCNHVSYVDIPALASVCPATFVSKAEVRRWPLFGLLARCGGTIFIQREKRTEVQHANEAIQERLGMGGLVVLFPEGTSSDGASVLPFRSSLLAPAVEGECLVTPAHISYEIDGGEPGREVAYWGDMTFGPHFLNLLTKTGVRCRVAWGQPRSGRDRKALAAALHQDVLDLARATPEATGPAARTG